jgi:hypothetical protein
LNWIARLRIFIKGLFCKKIPFPSIGDQELLVRGIVHPMFCHSDKPTLKREAFLPPPNKSDVSLLRLQYTNSNFCKKQAKGLKLGENKYCGLGLLLAKSVKETNTSTIGQGLEVEVRGTPINSTGEYVKLPPVFIKDPGLPMHADILYSEPLLKGVPATKHRALANQLAKLAIFHRDPTPLSENWDENIELKIAN